ncbi:MAG: hypothetical protein H0W07_08675 [Chloroflexi bacterium]|nr:hypothetical protein [Chloroflexota bacterium]
MAITEAGGYRPLTEFVLGRLGSLRPAWVVVLVLLPWLRDAVQFVLFRDAGLVGDGWITARAPTAVTNSYLILLSIWGAARVTRQLVALEGTDTGAGRDDGPMTARAGTPAAWLVPPVLLALLLTLVIEAGRIAEFGVAAARETPLPFALGAVIGFVMRLAPMTAFWTAVIVLVSLSRLGAPRVRPENFPPDRSLGMRPVGELAFSVFWLATAAFVPIFVIRSPSMLDVALSLGFFAVAGSVLVLALWRLHTAMARSKVICVEAARTRYAKAYRAALEDTDARDVERRAHGLAVAEALLRGADSIQEWPLDERMIRVVALIGVGVTTGVTVRLLTLPLGI